MNRLSNRFNKKTVYALILLYCLMFAAGLLLGLSRGSRVIKPDFAQAADGGDMLAVYFLNVGQADCTLITIADKVMMIDCGNAEDYAYIDGYLKGLKIDAVDLLVLTHPHEDHIGSAAQIISNYRIGKIYMTNRTVDNYIFLELLNAIDSKGYKITLPDYGEQFALGDAQVQFFGIEGDEACGANDASIITRVSFGKTSFMFMGDAEKEAESALLSEQNFIESDVLKVGHHGAGSSTSAALLERVNPQFAVVSCGVNNSYGHPAGQTLSRLYERDTKVFRTDRNGEISAVSDGISVKFTCQNSAYDDGRLDNAA